MANRSYLYSLGNRPTSYEDRPDTISGLSEWAYDVPFMYRLLMSCDPQPCASLISDGLDGTKVPLHAISSPFAPGFERVRRFVAIVRVLIESHAVPTPAAPPPETPGKSTLMDRMRRWAGLAPAPAASRPAPASIPAAPAALDHLPDWLDETLAFLEQHRDQYLLLETVELDVMSESDPDALRGLVDAEIGRCRRVGAAYEALPGDTAEAARVLQRAAAERHPAPLDAFFGLRFDDNCDSTRTGETEHPLGLEWNDVLYFELFNRAQFDAHQGKSD
ncbi:MULTISPECIES: DUF7822 domain-containing protein [Burkholderia]|nr:MULTISPECIES: hypothetical protein [Burkholderia]EKS9797601.1 hypothetical protein [Burkholderia cepacia]EKS9805311.1 hypothetical protein [Burkholderia cepacia]EKS9813219.1 hypothetical protein [Burkholderia cepacia]EKS9818555.1 hypothetical protein [Burkholderia cepacia]EKS9826294.1 hypothetical protein [Burkholderia cepacia]